MISHIFLPSVALRPVRLIPEHRTYLETWHRELIEKAEEEDVASSACLQGVMIELVTEGRPKFDWLGLFDECLSGPDNAPLAYSRKYTERLHGFGQQAVQSTIVSIHTRWWLESILVPSSVDHEKFARRLLTTKFRNGLIYDHDISETNFRHRMRSELTGSLAYSLEILCQARLLTKELRNELLASTIDPRKCPPSRYVSAEYFRLRALESLNGLQHFPVNIGEIINSCAEGLAVGYSDFSIADKTDAYMGSAKRTSRDKPVASPVISCHVAALSALIHDGDTKRTVLQRLDLYGAHLRSHPLDIQAFQMRDIPVPFGADKTPIEVICAAHLATRSQEQA